MNIKNIIERIKVVKSVLCSDEYFVMIANKVPNVEPWRDSIMYDYFDNTDRDIFYKFAKSYIDKK